LDHQRKQLSFIAEFSMEIRHISGQSNVVADTLSRPPIVAAVQVGDGPLPSGPASLPFRGDAAAGAGAILPPNF
jgi:hypothetical protein